MKFFVEVVEGFSLKHKNFKFLDYEFIKDCYFLRYNNYLLCFKYIKNDNEFIIEENDKIEVSLILDGFFDVIFGKKLLTEKEIDALLDDFFYKVVSRYSEIDISDFKDIQLELLGISVQRYYSYDEVADEFLELNFHMGSILFCKNKDNKYLAIHMYTYFGMCPSGYCSASWGECEIVVLDDNFVLDEHDILYWPKDKIYMHLSKNHFGYSLFIDNYAKLTNSEFGVIDFVGGDPYYPSGGSYINLPLEDIIGEISEEFVQFFDLFTLHYNNLILTDKVAVIPMTVLKCLLDGNDI